MMLPGLTTARHIISLFIAAIASVLAYYGYSTALVQATALTNLSRAIYYCLHQQALNCQDVEPEQQVVAEVRAVNDEQA